MILHERIAAARRVLSDNGWDAILVTNPANRRYLTGFTADDHGADESSGMLLLSAETAELYVSPTNLPWAEAEVSRDLVTVVASQTSRIESAADQVTSLGANTVAVEDTTTSAAAWFTFQELIPQDVTIVRAESAIDSLRALKSPREVSLLSNAASCTDAAFEYAVLGFRPGMTERGAADLIREALRRQGSEGEAFDTIIASGPNAAKPHHRPGSRKLRQGEPIIIDMGARIDGYNGDLSRTVCLGKPEERLVTIYEAVLAAQVAGLAAIQAGITAFTPDLATRGVFADHGLERYVIHGAGHGLGLRVHEAPSVSKRATAVLEAGNVITMEPGLYQAEWGGVRIEDVAVVEIDGHRNLTSAPKGLTAMSL